MMNLRRGRTESLVRCPPSTNRSTPFASGREHPITPRSSNRPAPVPRAQLITRPRDSLR